MEVGIDPSKNGDLKLLVKYLGDKVQVTLHEDPQLELPYLKVGNDTIRGTKTISLYLSSHEPTLLGKANIEKAEVDQWLTFCNTSIKPAIAAKNMKATRDFARVLNEILLQRVYFAANYLTVADLIIYANVYTYMENLTKKQRFEVCNLSRWFDLIQHSDRVNLEKPLIDIDLDEPATPAAPVKKGKEAAEPSGEGKGKAEKGAPAASKEAAPKAEKGKEQPKAKEAAAPKGAKEAAPAKDDEAEGSNVDVSRLNLKVGRILEVKRHADADSLYVEQIDVGEEKPRNVVSGLVKFMTMEEMQNRLVIVVANMKPAAMRGVTSEAMVLCANDGGNKVEFVDPPAGSQPGDRVFVEGYETGTPDAVLNPKKKIFEKIQPDFITSPELIATYKGKPFKTSKGVCTVKSIVGGPIK